LHVIECTFFIVIFHHAQAKKGVSWGVISWNNYAASELNIVQSNALETWARAPCCGPRPSARRPSRGAPNGTGPATSQSGAPPTFSASVAAAATAASASAAAAVFQWRWFRDRLAAVLLGTPSLWHMGRSHTSFSLTCLT